MSTNPLSKLRAAVSCDRRADPERAKVVLAAKALYREFDRRLEEQGLAHVSVDALARQGQVTPAFVKLYRATRTLVAAEEREAAHENEFVVVREPGAGSPEAKRRKDVTPRDLILWDRSGDYHAKTAKLALEDHRAAVERSVRPPKSWNR